MPRHVKLPPQNAVPKKPVVPSTPSIKNNDFGADRIARQLEEGHFAYVMRVKMINSNLSSLHFLSHHTRFNTEDFQKMVAEACAICVNNRLGSRRHQLAEAKTPIYEPVKTNETLFEGDADFVEVVMCDKWGFRKLLYNIADGEIEGTVKL